MRTSLSESRAGIKAKKNLVLEKGSIDILFTNQISMLLLNVWPRIKPLLCVGKFYSTGNTRLLSDAAVAVKPERYTFSQGKVL